MDRLGAVLERLGGILGRLDASLARLGAILGRLGAILTRLGAIMGRLVAILASQKPPNIGPTSLQDASQDDLQLSSKLRSNLEPFGDQQNLLKPTKNHKKNLI